MKELYKEYEEDMRFSYRNSVRKTTEEDISKTMTDLKIDLETKELDDSNEDQHTKTHKQWVTQRYTQAQISKRGDRVS